MKNLEWKDVLICVLIPISTVQNTSVGFAETVHSLAGCIVGLVSAMAKGRPALSPEPRIWFLFLLGSNALKKQLNMLANYGQKEQLSSNTLKWKLYLAYVLHCASRRL